MRYSASHENYRCDHFLRLQGCCLPRHWAHKGQRHEVGRLRSLRQGGPFSGCKPREAQMRPPVLCASGCSEKGCLKASPDWSTPYCSAFTRCNSIQWVMNNEEREAAITAAFNQMVATQDRGIRIVWWETMLRLIKERSPERVAQMEQERGLSRAASFPPLGSGIGSDRGNA